MFSRKPLASPDPNNPIALAPESDAASQNQQSVLEGLILQCRLTGPIDVCIEIEADYSTKS